ncbi:uncharacterized protein LOC143038663 isoform X2 [Oratosquilla oratoria]|uniref:uncharacterized protein LOC143038663 isoform X2 n=1 Tax=Oratosquilla oratoria TaxID=337810 RepID=UPI003F769529
MVSKDEKEERPPRKHRQIELSGQQCAICGASGEVMKCKDFESWCSILNAAKQHDNETILQHSKATEVPDVYYHSKCRKNIHPQVKNFNSLNHDTHQQWTKTAILPHQQKIDQDHCDEILKHPKTEFIVKFAFFCDKVSKYTRNSNTREPLIQSV